MNLEVKHYKVLSIPSVGEPNTVYYVLDTQSVPGQYKVKTYITDVNGIPIPLIDLSGISGITSVENMDGTITVVIASGVANVRISNSIMAIINSALQSGDPVSSLMNDAGYITIADVPVFDPSDYDLDEFNNASADPFAHVSEIPTFTSELTNDSGFLDEPAASMLYYPLLLNPSGYLTGYTETDPLFQSWLAGNPLGVYLPLAGGTMSGAIIQPIAPVGAFDLINKSYFDNVITGLTWKTEVKCSTTANHSLSGIANVDGVTVPAGTRVLVRFQTLPEQNGIYTSAAGAWTRATDADSATEVEASTVLVRSGTLYKNTQWTQSNVITTLGNDPVAYVQISGAGTYTNGVGLTLTGNVFSIGALAIVNSMINDVAWSKITGTPTTIAGYGITDFNSLGDARWSLLAHTHTFASLTSKPTTLSGYGITDALPILAGSTTGVVISFLTDMVYGTIASPETGNITANVSGALLGVTNIIIHNSGTAPTFGSEFKKLSGSGNYVINVINYIFCVYINSTEIIYSINQRT